MIKIRKKYPAVKTHKLNNTPSSLHRQIMQFHTKNHCAAKVREEIFQSILYLK